MERDGCQFATNSSIQSVSLLQTESTPQICVNFLAGDRQEEIIVDAVLFALGRVPNVEGMGLDVAEVEYDLRDGIIANDLY